MNGNGTSSQNSKQRTGEAEKKRRRRHPLSCVPCKDRKIKCDRNVPNCSSCVVRGIQRQCRWGDERDYDGTYFLERDTATRSGSTIRRGVQVDDVVDQVLKRLKGGHNHQRSQTASPEPSTSSPNTHIYRPFTLSAANIIPCTAFEGFKPRLSDPRIGQPISPSMFSRFNSTSSDRLIYMHANSRSSPLFTP
jgi:hypothetical protein